MRLYRANRAWLSGVGIALSKSCRMILLATPSKQIGQMNLYGLYISCTLLAIFVFAAFNCYNGYGNILGGERKDETPVVLLVSPTPVVSCGGCDRFLHTSMVP